MTIMRGIVMRWEWTRKKDSGIDEQKVENIFKREER